VKNVFSCEQVKLKVQNGGCGVVGYVRMEELGSGG
jgi:hypothetical protein